MMVDSLLEGMDGVLTQLSLDKKRAVQLMATIHAVLNALGA